MVHSAVLRLQENLRDILINDLLLRFTPDWKLGHGSSKLEDNLTFAATGANFMSLSQNKEFCITSFLAFMSHICGDPLRASQFLNEHANVDQRQEPDVNTENSVEPAEVPKTSPLSHFLSVDDDAVIQYLKHCNEAVEIILVLINLTGGAPARATELELYQLVNSEAAMRNLFVQQSRLMVLSPYNKTSSMTRKEKLICRYLDKESFAPILKFLVLIRPFQSALLKAKLGQDVSRDNEKYLFTTDGVCITTNRIRTFISKWFSKMETVAFRSSAALQIRKSQFDSPAFYRN